MSVTFSSTADWAAPRSPAASALPTLRRLWRRLPATVRRRLADGTRWTGIPFLVSFALDYRRATDPAQFAGHLSALLAAYPTASADERQRIRARLDGIVDALTLPNGVRKTTYAGRQERLLREILDDPACALPARALRVLDLPASTGAAAPASRACLAATHDIADYVLGDLSFHLQLDPARRCVYDAEGSLLQVLEHGRVRHVHLPHAAGAEYSWLTRLALAPLAARGRRLAAQHVLRDASGLQPVPLLHPDVAAGVREGRFSLRIADVFVPISGAFDLIISCNLLQRNYFSEDAIARGIDNLGRSLTDQGLLIVGSPDAGLDGGHRVYRRVGERLVLVRAHGAL